MPILTIKNSVNNIRNLFNDIVGGNSAYYIWVGRTLPWPNEPNPPVDINSYNAIEGSIYHDIVFGKLLTNTNITFLVNNNIWANGTIYSNYDPNDGSLLTKNFYITNQFGNIYKCIDNNGGANSTIQPQITPTSGNFQTSDGYVWKYMTTSSLANNLFGNSFIAVAPNNAVTTGAIPGTIDVTRVTSRGNNYQGYLTGNLTSVINPTNYILSNTASLVNNFYVGSTLLIGGGLGGVQIKDIVSYNGATQTAIVNNAMTIYTTLYVGANSAGTLNLTQPFVQNLTTVFYGYPQGSFNSGDHVIQSDTNAFGSVASIGNSTTMTLDQDTSNPMILSYPIVDTVSAGTIKTGLVNVTAGSNVVIANTTANLLALYTVGEFIQVGSNTLSGVRRVTSITNSSYANVSVSFSTSLASNVHYHIPIAIEPISYVFKNTTGIITQVNLTTIIVNYANVNNASLNFIVGETVKEYNGLGVDQGANGVVSFTNSTAVVLSSVSGVISPGLFILGLSSGLQAQTSSIASYPYVVVSNVVGSYQMGYIGYAQWQNNVSTGNATVLSLSQSLSAGAPFIVSPKVNYVGDGSGTISYSVVNTAIGSSHEITGIVTINNGNNYTVANAFITANSQWGTGAVLYSVISPASGQGSDIYDELGSNKAGISMTINSAANENYYFPNYGTYRKVGIIRNPLFQQVNITTDNVHRKTIKLGVSLGTFSSGEIVFQPSTNSGATLIFANSTVMELDLVNGTLSSNAISNTVNSTIIGLISNAQATILSYTNNVFQILSNTQILTQKSANVIITNIANNNIFTIINVPGIFSTNSLISDPTINAIANVFSIQTANGTTNASSFFGQRFNNTTRLTITSSSTPGIFYTVGEYINQPASNASGVVIDITHELDINYNAISGTITSGLLLTDANTGANGVVKFANSTYIKLTGIQGTFNPNNIISTISANGIINITYPVIVVGDVNSPFFYNYNIIGNTSGMGGLTSIANTTAYNDLVRNSGQVIYLNSTLPFTPNLTSKETFNIIVGM